MSPMIDRDARDRLADVTDRFIAGEIDAVDYDSRARKIRASDDLGANEVYSLLWFTYSDFARRRIGDLSPEAGAAFRRAAVFLRTDLAYLWPDTRPVVRRNVLRIVVGILAMIAGLWLAVTGVSMLGGMAAGAVGLALLVAGFWVSQVEIDFDIWPFATKEQMREYMGGSGSPQNDNG